MTDQHAGDGQDQPSPGAAARVLTVAELDDGVRAVHGIDPALDRDGLTGLAAVRLTLVLWRNSPLEDIHAAATGLDDGQMLAANVEVTRLLLTHVHHEGVDWDTIVEVLTDPARPVAGTPLVMTGTRSEIFALSAHIRDHVQQYRRAQQLVGWPRLLRALALMCQSNWWGTPWWPDTVTQWLTEAAETIRSDAPPGWRDVERLGGALLEAPDALPQVVRTWCVHHDLGHAPGRDRYKARVGIAAPPPSDRPWSHLDGPYGWLAPMPPQWSYALMDHGRYQSGGPSRPTARQVASRDGSTSVWVTHLTGAGLHRLLEQVEVGHEVFLNGNPLPAHRNKPAFLGTGRVRATGAGWVAIDVANPTITPPFTAVFATADADPAQLRALLGPLDRHGRYRARLWRAGHDASAAVTAVHWPDPAEVDQAFR
ncbi:MAG TPA: hypothetical protein VHN80_24885 [Kineosporiaceae bacterium]|nr:hypothetical protein [Kineosporiaceae bacterium]